MQRCLDFLASVNACTTMAKQASIIIVGGGGTFGASTALELARRGYTNVTALDVHPCPSDWSAGNDLNKIVRTEYADPFYSDLAQQAVQTWQQDAIFRKHFHQTGWVVIGTDPGQLQQWKGRSASSSSCHLLHSKELNRHVPQLAALRCDTLTWRAAWNSANGWVAAKEALRDAGAEARRLGVEYITGAAGQVVKIRQTTTGAVLIHTADGQTQTADHVIVCVGAWIDKLVDMQGQCQAKVSACVPPLLCDTAESLYSQCWTVGHVQLTPRECEELRGMPVVVDAELGFFFEPSADGKLKFCNEFPGYTNCVQSPWNPSTSLSIPSTIKYAMPQEAQDQLEEMRRKLFPRFTDRPIQDQMICWCTDSPDRSWIIDAHPDMPNVLLATGDSGMAFKFLPTIGKHIADALEGKLDGEQRNKWKWRPSMAAKPVAETRGPGDVKDLKALKGWPERASL